MADKSKVTGGSRARYTFIAVAQRMHRFALSLFAVAALGADLQAREQAPLVASTIRAADQRFALAQGDDSLMLYKPTHADEPSEVCPDSEFLRRVSLDMTGTLPTPQEVEAFLADPSPDKRVKKVEELLARPTYVARWTTKLCEITGNSPRHFDGTGPMEEYARQWYEWIARRVRENVPYDQIVAGIALGHSRRPDQSYRDFIEEQSAYYREKDPVDFTARETMPYYWARHTVRLPEERALSFSYTFLGVRLDCAQCHKHPFDRWTQDDFQGFTAFFERVGFGVGLDARKMHQELIKKLGDKGNQNQRERARLLRARKGEIVPWNEVFWRRPG